MPRLLLALTVALGSPDTLSVADLQSAYATIFRVDTVAIDGQVFYAQSVRVPAPRHPLAALVRDNELLLTYVVQHAPAFDLRAVLGPATGVADRQARYASALRADARFNDAVLPLVVRYMRARGGELRGVDPRLAAARPLPRSALTRVAVRFFSPFLDADRTVAAHVCTALNDVADLPGAPDVVLEGFAYATIMAEMGRAPAPRFGDDFTAALRLMNALELSDDSAQRLDRARGVMWGVMAHSAGLATALDEAYARRSAYLPFVLRDQ